MRSSKLTEHEFSKLFDFLPGFFVVVNDHFVIVAANKNYLNKRGSRDFIGKKIEDELPFALSAIEKVIGERKDHVGFFTTENGKYTAIHFTPVEDEGGEVRHVIMKLEDELVNNTVDEKQEVPAALFESLFDLNPAAMAISRIRDAKIIHVNEAVIRLLEFESKEDLLGKTSAELNLLVDQGQRESFIELIKNQRKVVHTEGSIRTHKGNIKWAAISVIVVNLAGEPCLLAVLIDTTDKKSAENEIRRINTDLEKTIAEKTKQVLETESEYRSVVEQASDAIFLADSRGNYVDVNPSACALLGYTQAELLSMNTLDVLAPEEISNPPRFAELMKGRTLLTTRMFRRKDGALIPVEISGRMLSNGKMLGIVRDITERRKSEEAIQQLNLRLEEKVRDRTAALEQKIIELKESEEKFTKAFQTSAAGLTIAKLADATYVEVNDAFLNMIGYERHEVLGRTAIDLSLVIDMQRRDEVFKEVREHGAAKNIEMTIRRKDGRQIEILSSIETITHHGEKYAINIIYDITERKRAQEKLEAVNKELESFSYSVSHDLRAPLRSIMGYAEILQLDFSTKLDETMRSHLGRIINSAKKMGRLIDDLLEFSRVGKLELSKTKIDTKKVVDKQIHEFQLAGASKPKFIVADLLPSYADFSMLNQVWYNFISNAIKYSSKKDSPVIEIGSYVDQHETVFYVKDNGAGFSMEFAAKLFGVFQRLHRAADFDGTGVGLALVKRIIDKHDGRVWADAVEGKGATFYFSLPGNQLS